MAFKLYIVVFLFQTSKKFSVQINFDPNSTVADLTTNERRILTDCACFTFTSNDGNMKSFTARELEKFVFGKFILFINLIYIITINWDFYVL